MPADSRAKKLIERTKQTMPARLATAYGQSQASNYAASLAFNAFLTMFPLMLGVLAVVGLAIHDPGALDQIQRMVISAFPSDAQPQLLNALQGTRRAAGWLSVVSIAGLIWTGTGLFAAMEFALTEVFGTKQRDMLRQRAMGIIMMVLFVLAVIVAVTANGAASVVPFMPVGGFLVGAIVMIALLAAIYRFVPNRTFALRDVLPGAVLAGLLIEVLSLAFPVYSRVSHGFNTYGQQFALFFLLATWLYFLSQLLLLGAVYNRMRLGRPGTEGVVAAPPADTRQKREPVEAINEQKAAPTDRPATDESARNRARVDRRAGRRHTSGGEKRGIRRRILAFAVLGYVFVRALFGRYRRRTVA